MQNVNYEGLNSLWGNYSAHGFSLLAFPSNQFGAQAPASNECECAYMFHKIQLPAGSFPCFDKTDVNGPDTPEAYAILKTNTPGHDAGFDIMWNYEKFVVAPNGSGVARFASDADPMDAEPIIRKLLGLS